MQWVQFWTWFSSSNFEIIIFSLFFSRNRMNFSGEKIIVTGAGKGIGEGIVRKLVSLGAHVYGIYPLRGGIVEH